MVRPFAHGADANKLLLPNKKAKVEGEAKRKRQTRSLREQEEELRAGGRRRVEGAIPRCN